MYRKGQNHKNLYQHILLVNVKIIGFIFRETRKGLSYSGKLYHSYLQSNSTTDISERLSGSGITTKPTQFYWSSLVA